MSKKLALLGMLSPDKTPGISEKTEIQTTQPVGKAGPPEPSGGKPERRSRSNPDRFDPIDEIAKEFVSYRSKPEDPKWSRIHRERFYQSVWKLAERLTQYHLRGQNWKGDVTQDAMDITAAFCEGLLKQEKNRTGMFDSTERNPSELRGYLNHTFHNGVREQAWKFRKSRREWLSFEEDAVMAAVDARKSDWLTQVIRLTKAVNAARDGNIKIPSSSVGTTSLDLVLRLALNRKVAGGEAKKLVPRKGVPVRTRQNWEKKFRSDIRHELEI